MFKKAFSNKEILNLIRNGDEDKALAYLYKKVLPKVKNLVKKYRIDDIDAYDIFQEALLKFYDYVKRDKFNEKYTIEAFMITIARNKIIDITRVLKNRPEVEISDLNHSEEYNQDSNSMISEERKKNLDDLFSSIGERCKELLLLSIFDKRSMTEISETLGFSSENSAKTQNYKCKQKLIKKLEQDPVLAKEVLSYV